MTHWRSSPIDERRLNMPAHLLPRQRPSRREHVHGRIQPMDLPPPTRGDIALMLFLFIAGGTFTAWCATF